MPVRLGRAAVVAEGGELAATAAMQAEPFEVTVGDRQVQAVPAGGGGNAVSQRLMEMGLIDGSTVEVVRIAPLGDPMELHLHGYNLSLRKSEAALVEVEHCQ